MSKKLTMLCLLSSFMLGSCVINNGRQDESEQTEESQGGGSSEKSDEEKEAYDQWLNSISKPGHLYFHYNRGEKKDYDQYCLWLWQHAPSDLEGTLWAYSGDPVVSSKLTLKPMSTAWMSYNDVGKSAEGSGDYIDDYGVIADVDLYKSGLIGGKTGSTTSFEGASELGFLMVKQSSMDGSTNWTSDGGKETYIDNFNNQNNWRTLVSGGKAIHVFVSSGALRKYSFFAGSGAPQVQINPINEDATGKYRSDIQAYNDVFDVTSTSEAFKKLGVGYQIFVASFRDSNGDGYGDIRGIIDSLDYLEGLGVECLWLTPIQKSDSYHGYDISDYYDVDKRFGTIDDYRELIYKAHKKGMKVLMDLVLNHTSKNNVWFEKSQWGVNEDLTKNEWRDVFTWKYRSDTIKKAELEKISSNPDKYRVKRWYDISVEEDARSSNPSWYRDGESNYYYYGKFGSGMPEINYQSPLTRQLVIDMAKYWMSFGLDGYRLDAVKHIFMKDECFDDNDIWIEDVGKKSTFDDEKGEYVEKEYDYSSNITKNITWWKEFSNSIKADYPNCFLVGENFDGWGKQTAPYYRALDSQFSFSHYYHIPAYLFNSDGGAGTFAYKQAAESFDVYSTSDSVPLDGKDMSVPGGCRPDFIDGAFTSNHDVMRAINQANGVGTIDGTTADAKIDEYDYSAISKAKTHAAVTLLNRGLSWIYYGDELGMSSNTDTHIDMYGSENSIDIWYRQPFLWQDETNRAGYKAGQYYFGKVTEPDGTVVDRYDSWNKTVATAEAQVSDPNSMYNWYRQLIAIKKLYGKVGDVRIIYNATSSQNVMVIRVNDPFGTCKYVIYINTGSSSTYLMDPGYVAFGASGSGTAVTAIKTMGGAPTGLLGDIGQCPNGIAVFAFNDAPTE